MKNIILNLLIILGFATSVSAQGTFRSTSYDYSLKELPGFTRKSVSDYDYYAMGSNDCVISVRITRLPGEGTPELFNKIPDETILSGFRKRFENPRIVTTGIGNVNGRDYFYSVLTVGANSKVRISSCIFFKGKDMYELTTESNVGDVESMRSAYRSVVESFVLR